MAEMVAEAKKQAMELGKIDDMSAAEVDQLAEMIGLGALKYFLLKVDPKKRMMFDPNESISLQGHTGPFIQYTHARIRALLRKAAERGLAPATQAALPALEKSEREVIVRLNQYAARVQEAARDYSPAVIANYAYELAKDYNQFYQTVSILSEADATKLSFRLMLSATVADVIRHSMSLLGIQVPERM